MSRVGSQKILVKNRSDNFVKKNRELESDVFQTNSPALIIIK